MKQLILSASVVVLSTCGFAQTQIGNSDFEQWEGVSSGEEPVNWNSFMTASGGFNGFADVQIEQSTNVRPGSAGTTSARIWSRNAGFGVTANGNMTLGQVNMGAITANDPANHNITRTGDADFSEAMTDMPDSIVFWVNYLPSDTTAGEEARMKATLHDDYDYRDPEDGASSAEVVATAELNYAYTGGWVRMAVPFDYSGPASNVAYILVTFTTNAVPGGGAPDDQVWIDDVELIYNGGGGAGLNEAATFPINVFMNNESNELNFVADGQHGQFEVLDMKGAVVLSGETANTVTFNAPAGIYMVNVAVGNEIKRFKVYHQ
ncbi:MAG: T9SS type A sorting domain-containing protein [bacterium]|nr:T9SS type A sorting domain-containing protein [bacterium]